MDFIKMSKNLFFIRNLLLKPLNSRFFVIFQILILLFLCFIVLRNELGGFNRPSSDLLILKKIDEKDCADRINSFLSKEFNNPYDGTAINLRGDDICIDAIHKLTRVKLLQYSSGTFYEGSISANVNYYSDNYFWIAVHLFISALFILPELLIFFVPFYAVSVLGYYVLQQKRIIKYLKHILWDKEFLIKMSLLLTMVILATIVVSKIADFIKKIS